MQRTLKDGGPNGTTLVLDDAVITATRTDSAGHKAIQWCDMSVADRITAAYALIDSIADDALAVAPSDLTGLASLCGVARSTLDKKVADNVRANHNINSLIGG